MLQENSQKCTPSWQFLRCPMAYNRYRISHKKELYYILCIVAVAIILLYSFLGPRGYRDLRKIRFETQEKRARIEDLKRSNDDRMKNIEAMRSDKEALEKYAREKGYGREGEIIQQLPPQPEKKAK
jgi:cell division protein FtsB